MRTTVYSDADGIWVAWTNHNFRAAPAEHTGWQRWHLVTIPGSFPGYWAEEPVEAMNRIAGRPDVTIKWLTGWEEDAPEQLAPTIGLQGAWEMIPGIDEDDIVNGDWWKLGKIREDIARTKPDRVVWLEDDVLSNSKALAWLETLEIPVLVICPKTAHGLTRDHLAEIEAFLEP